MNLLGYICGELAVDRCEVISRRRDRLLIEKRKIVICALRLMNWSFCKIGREIKRDHTTVSYLYKSTSDKEKKVAEIIAMSWRKYGK